MRVLKFLGYLLLIFIAFLAIAGIFLPEKAEISVSRSMAVKPEVVFRQVNSFRNWEKWNPFGMNDSAMHLEFSGPVLGKDEVFQWKSKDMGDGLMNRLRSEPYTSIVSELEMGNSGKAFDEWRFESSNDSVKVIWTVKVNELTYPFGRYYGAFLGSIMHPLMESGLAKLEKVAVLEPVPVVIEIIHMEEQPCILVEDSVRYSEMNDFIESGMADLQLYMKNYKVSAVGPAFNLYYNWDTTSFIRMAVGIPVAEEVKESGRVRYFKRAGGPAVKAISIGSYENLGRAHQELEWYFTEFFLPWSQLPVCEEYVKHPGNEIDVNKWQTNIYYYFGE